MMGLVAGALDGEEDHLDGLTVAWDDRWLNLRTSNTEPLLRLNVEAPDNAAVDDLVGRVRDVVVANGGTPD